MWVEGEQGQSVWWWIGPQTLVCVWLVCWLFVLTQTYETWQKEGVFPLPSTYSSLTRAGGDCQAVEGGGGGGAHLVCLRAGLRAGHTSLTRRAL